MPEHPPTQDLPVGDPVPGSDAAPPSRATLEGRWVTLRPVDPEADAHQLYSISHGDPETESLWTYMGYGPFSDAASMQAWLSDIARPNDPLFFTVLDRASAAPIGMAALQRFKARYRVVETAHLWYGPKYRRSPVNTETLYLLLVDAFERMRCRRVEWKCDVLNARSRAAALRLGFRFEAIFEQHMIIKGLSRNTAWYAMFADDWPVFKSRMEQALYSESYVSLSQLNAVSED